MMQYELTSKAVNLMFGYFTFFFSWAVVLCQWNFIRETWVKVSALVLPVFLVLVGIYALRENPELYIRITEDTGIQEAESRQEEDSAVLNEWKDGDTAYRIIYMKDTKVKYIVVDDGGSQVTITPLYNADGTLQVYGESQ